MNVEFLAAAETELDQAYQWYEQQQSGLGKQYLSEFDAAIRRITAFPKSYVLIDTEIRRCLIKRFPYGVLYGIDRQSIIVVAVAHLHRKPDYWLARIG
ncbi:type II toxin-antitoxin system RelE/ParE family toxin [Methylomonas sp. EFPC3]|uniref:type II toxin-antitoxin system RelE/ParE family toxin n=1 Tax=Methylomonas sp. EFPC3 TaxID=3021710 RepID=UPI00241789E4|nr:type II toxin-antitoxin system RelE/ParE family toxin [Methylomonas sp. EFPC3]WFP49860.1 type II toxin-antitoxin system RelE/ParE family toxin [Methylomonas sp. EFPC3]